MSQKNSHDSSANVVLSPAKVRRIFRRNELEHRYSHTHHHMTQKQKRQRSDSEEAYVTAKELDIKNPMPQIHVPPSYTTKGTNGDRIVIVMVGLPARGKTYMVNIKRSITLNHTHTYIHTNRQIESRDISPFFTVQLQKCST